MQTHNKNLSIVLQPYLIHIFLLNLIEKLNPKIINQIESQ